MNTPSTNKCCEKCDLLDEGGRHQARPNCKCECHDESTHPTSASGLHVGACPCHKAPVSVCGVETNWTEFAPQRFCQNTKPCPLHDKPKEYRCPNGYSSTDCIRHCYEQHPQQEEASPKKGKNTRLARHFLSQDLPNRSFKNSHTESGYKLGVYAFASFLDHKK